MLEQRVNPDLVEEREKCNFDKNELKLTIHDQEELEGYESYVEDIKKYPELKTD